MTKSNITPKQIDDILPQTQCGLCGYGGCMPYAEALVNENAAINLCPPGGVKGLRAIANLVNQDPEPFVEDMQQKAKPKLLAVIREDECIGCTKCIQACPVDAILGTGKLMHTVIADECTGCELCVAPCPVDCIEMVLSSDATEEKADHYRGRFNARNERLLQNSVLREKRETPNVGDDKKAFLQEALERARLKKLGV